LDFEAWQHFIPLMEPMPQDFICEWLASVAAEQRPQGIKVTMTPRIKKIRLSTKATFFMY